MKPSPFTQKWPEVPQLVLELDENDRAAANGWIWPIALVLNAAPAIGYPSLPFYEA